VPPPSSGNTATPPLIDTVGPSVDASNRCVRLRSPRLPAFVDWLRIERLRVGDAQVDLLLQRYRDSVGVDITQRTGDVEVSVLV
jgi:hypothetical protein